MVSLVRPTLNLDGRMDRVYFHHQGKSRFAIRWRRRAKAAVEEARQEPGAGEPEEGGGPPVPTRAAQDLGERLFPGEDRAVRQDEVHRLEAGGLGDRGESRTGFRGAAGEIFEGVGERRRCAGPSRRPRGTPGNPRRRSGRPRARSSAHCMPGSRGNVPSVAFHKYGVAPRGLMRRIRQGVATETYWESTARERERSRGGCSGTRMQPYL